MLVFDAGLAISLLVLLTEVIVTLLALIVSCLAPKTLWSIHRSILILQQVFMLVYVSLFLNPFKFFEQTNEELITNLVKFEFFASFSINIIYLCLLWKLTSAHFPFLTPAVLIFFGLLLFSIASISEWANKDPLELNICKFYMYQGLHLTLLFFITKTLIYFTWKLKNYPFSSLLFYNNFVLYTYILFISLPKIFLVHFISSKSEKPDFVRSLLRGALFIAPIYNLLFLFFINYQQFRERQEIKIFIDKLFHSKQSQPVPHISISVEEPSVGMRRSHIALNLMRNPLNSFNKLQRQWDGTVSNVLDGSNMSNLFLNVPKEHYDQRQAEKEAKKGMNIGRWFLRRKAKSESSSPRPKDKEFQNFAVMRRASLAEGVKSHKNAVFLLPDDQIEPITKPTEQTATKIVISFPVEGSILPVESEHINRASFFVPKTSQEMPQPQPHPQLKRSRTADRIFSVLERTRRSEFKKGPGPAVSLAPARNQMERF